MFYYANNLLLFTYKIHKPPLKTVSSSNILATFIRASGVAVVVADFLLSTQPDNLL